MFTHLALLFYLLPRRQKLTQAHSFDLNPQEIARFIQDAMTGYEVYFVDHPEKVAKYGAVYGDIDAILDANPDVEAMGE